MKNNFLKSFVLLFTFAAVFTSCTSDDGESTNEGESTGDYLPLAINNEWSFTDGSQIVLSSQEEHDGNTYYMYSGENPYSDVEISQGFRKSGAAYYMYTEDVEIEFGGASIFTEGFEFIVLKDDLEVGESIASDVVNVTETNLPELGSTTISTNSTYTSTIDEKFETLTINGVDYVDVIKVRLLLVSEGVESTTYYYFGNNVGLLKIESDLGLSTELESYSLN